MITASAHPNEYILQPPKGSPAERRLRILQISTFDIGGGAEKVAWNLFRGYRQRGHGSWLAVGNKRGEDPDVLQIPKVEIGGSWKSYWDQLQTRLIPYQNGGKFVSRAQTALRMLANPRHELQSRFGLEDFEFPGARQVLQLPPHRPNIVHCHNLHGGYFDPRIIPALSRRVPIVFTLHDAWLLSGHCAHSFECERWKSGCGQCPDLTIYPAIGRDATAWNWRRKNRIYAKSRLHLATPSRWLMRKVEESMLSQAVEQARVIPYGTDLNVFKPGSKVNSRIRFGLPLEADILIFTANGIRQNIFKDYRTMRSAIAQLAERRSQRPLVFIALGEDAPAERIGPAEVRFVPYQKDPAVVAGYYQAADIYIHSARADTFPNTVLEALACGTPVVATAVGGIPEQIKSLRLLDCRMSAAQPKAYDLSEATGLLVAPGDPDMMAVSIEQILDNDTMRRRLGENGAKDAATRFDLQREVNNYLSWYEELRPDSHHP
jgi:glycosyltransferase involved in cell wall biosynthesis